ncbi:PKD domain-containing protein [Halomicrobium katesii]|uniref:PKD domain-containing protein n=1 Tax=Halomicrobium katesii TaxID=437163 RepID=UPI000364B8EE|nr:PKD domain-containing protein [Halomicrobium katesii]
MDSTRRSVLKHASLLSAGLAGVSAAGGQSSGDGVDSQAIDPDYSVFADRALWCWVPASIITDGETVMDGYDGRWNLFFDKADAHGIETFYPHYSDPTTGEQLEEPVTAADDGGVETFLRECHANGINVEPLIGGGVAGWPAAEAWPQAQSILDWNDAHPPEERFDGIHVNVENGDRYEVKPEILDRLDDAADDLNVSMSQDPMWARNTDNDRVREVIEHRNLDYYCTMVYDRNEATFWPNLGRVTQPFDTPFVVGLGINEHGHPNRNYSDADTLYGWVEDNWTVGSPDTSYQYIDEETGDKYLGISLHSFWGLIDAPEVGSETNVGEPSREYRTDPAPDDSPDPTPTPDPEPEPPVAVVSTSSDAAAPAETVTFDASNSTAPDGSLTGYAWELGDGTTATGQQVEHAYDSAGEYTVSLTVTDDNDNTDTATTTITVSDSDADDPVAAFSVRPSEPVVGEAVTFDADESTAPAGEIVEYRWDYTVTPGLEQKGEQFTHTYESAETLDVRLVVVDDSGTQAETIRTITVEAESTPTLEPDPEYPAWDADTAYTGGDRVTHDGKVWEAQWWTNGDEPGAGDWGPWSVVETDDETPTPEPDPTPTPEPDQPEWDADTTYSSGDRVVYEGSVWEAQWWTNGDEPGASDWGPWTQVSYSSH